MNECCNTVGNCRPKWRIILLTIKWNVKNAFKIIFQKAPQLKSALNQNKQFYTQINTRAKIQITQVILTISSIFNYDLNIRAKIKSWPKFRDFLKVCIWIVRKNSWKCFSRGRVILWQPWHKKVLPLLNKNAERPGSLFENAKERSKNSFGSTIFTELSKTIAKDCSSSVVLYFLLCIRLKQWISKVGQFVLELNRSEMLFTFIICKRGR